MLYTFDQLQTSEAKRQAHLAVCREFAPSDEDKLDPSYEAHMMRKLYREIRTDVTFALACFEENTGIEALFTESGSLAN